MIDLLKSKLSLAMSNKAVLQQLQPVTIRTVPASPMLHKKSSISSRSLYEARQCGWDYYVKL